MGKKVLTIELKEAESVLNEEGEYEVRYINAEKHPAFLTHRALASGRNDGLTKSSLISELVRLNAMTDESGDIAPEKLTEEQAEGLDAERYLPVIYLGLKGANKNFKLSYEEFQDRYHADLTQILTDYSELIEGYISEDPNAFKKGLEKSTSKKSKKASKK